MTTMNRISFATYGDASVLEYQTAPAPDPGPGEVLIRVLAAGVNYSDILRRRNTYFMPTPLPYTPGAEAVGIVESIGPGGDSLPFGTGDRVLAILPGGGGYGTHALAPAAYCVPLPPQISDAEATGIFVQGTTAWLLIHKAAGQSLAGKTVLVHAAAGGVGSLLVQMAMMAGATVIGATGTAAKLSAISGYGAIPVLTSEPAWASRVLEANGQQPVDVVFEMAGGIIYEQSFGCLAPGGTMVVFGAASGHQGKIHSEHFVDENQTVTGFNLAYYLQHRTGEWQEALGAVIGLLVEKKIRVETPHVYPLQDAARAHADIESRQSTGKVVLIP